MLIQKLGSITDPAADYKKHLNFFMHVSQELCVYSRTVSHDISCDSSSEMHHAIFTLSGDNQFVRLAGQFIITSIVVVPVFGSSDPETDGKL